MRVSLITDELSSDLETALELAAGWGVEGVELRGVGSRRYPDVSELWRARIPELLDEWRLPVAALSPGLFKIPLAAVPAPETRILRWEDAVVRRRAAEADGLVRAHLEQLLPAAIEAARALSCPTIVAFSFDRGSGQGPGARLPEAGLDVLREAARRVEAAGLTLAIEVEHVCYGDTAARTAEIVERIGSPAVGVNWDPANAYRAGEDRPFPDGWAAVRELVRHVHFKQASTLSDGRRGFTPQGVVDWSGQLAALAADGYGGWISVEPHVTPKVSWAARAVEQLRALLEDLR